MPRPRAPAAARPPEPEWPFRGSPRRELAGAGAAMDHQARRQRGRGRQAQDGPRCATVKAGRWLWTRLKPAAATPQTSPRRGRAGFARRALLESCGQPRTRPICQPVAIKTRRREARPPRWRHQTGSIKSIEVESLNRAPATAKVPARRSSAARPRRRPIRDWPNSTPT